MAAKKRAPGLKSYAGIGRTELFSLAVCLPLCGLAFSGWPVGGGGIAAWAAALLCGLLIWGGLLCFVRLFAGLRLGEALGYAFGRAFGRITLFLYCLLWLALCLCDTAYAVLLWQALGLGGTPLWLYALLFLLTASVMAAGGEESLARLALPVVVPALVLVLGNLCLTLIGADMGNLLPVESVSPQALRGGVWGGLLCFGALCVLLPYFYQVNEVKRRGGTLLAAVWLAAALLLILGFGAQVVLSASLPLYRFPLLQVFRLAEVGHWFSRFEVIGAGLLVMLLLLKAAAELGASASSLRELWGIKLGGRKSLAVSLGTGVLLWLLLMYGGVWFADWWELLVWLAGVLPYALLFGAVLLPWAAIFTGWLHLRADSRTVVIKREEGL